MRIEIKENGHPYRQTDKRGNGILSFCRQALLWESLCCTAKLPTSTSVVVDDDDATGQGQHFIHPSSVRGYNSMNERVSECPVHIYVTEKIVRNLEDQSRINTT